MDTLFIVILLAVGLVVFLFVWLQSDSTSVEDKLRILPNLYLLLILHVVISLLLPWKESNLSNLFIIFGILTFLLGGIFALWTKFVMGANFGKSGDHDITRQRVLITYGPFLISRNPITVGMLLMFIGSSMALQSYSIFLIIPVAYYAYTLIKKEEVLLEEYFAEEYIDYKSQVPRFLIV